MAVRQEFSDLLKYPLSELRLAQQYLRRTNGNRAAQKEVLEFQNQMQSLNVPTTLYLPTYRRIELELERVMSNVPEYYKSEIRSTLKTGISTEFIVEQIKFGMEDINEVVVSFERQTRDFARNRFNR